MVVVEVAGSPHTPVQDAPEKSFHVFISYRVRSDGELAERICDKLQAMSMLNEQREMRIRCFLDKQNLTHGQNYQTEFLEGLQGSCLFLPIISYGALSPMTSIEEQGTDNVLLEWQMALDLKDDGLISIIPILVGSVSNDLYRRFDSFYIAKEIPPVKLALSQSERNCRETVDEIFKLQGIFLNPTEMNDKLKVIVERLSSDIWPRYRAQWADQSSLGLEATSTCVQCEKDFRNSENGDGACRFHLSTDTNYRRDAWNCCGAEIANLGCQRARHRAKHHNDYDYGNKGTWMSNILNYVNHSEEHCSIASEDYSPDKDEKDTTITIAAGRVLSAAINDKNKLYITCYANGRRYLFVFSPEDIAGADHNKPVWVYNSMNGGFAEVDWIVFDNEIRGVKMSCQSRTASVPASCVLRFEWPAIPDDNGPIATSIVYEDVPTFGEVPLDPNFKYDLPVGSFSKGPTIKAPQARKRDESLPTWFAPDCPLRAKVKSTEAQHSRFNVQDVLTVEVVVMNPSKDNVSVVSAKSFARLRVDPAVQPQEFEDLGANDGSNGQPIRLSGKEWVEASRTVALGLAPPVTEQPPVPANPFPNNFGRHAAPPPVFRPPPKPEPVELPVMVVAGGTTTIEVRTIIKTDGYGGNEVEDAWTRFSLIALRTGSPVIVDIELEDLAGNRFGCMAEFPIPDLRLAVPDPNYIFFLYVDNVPAVDRFTVYFEKMSPDTSREDFTGTDSQYNSGLDLIKVRSPGRGSTISVKLLRRIVSRAIDAGTDVLDITEDIISDQSSLTKVQYHALIDLQRRSVYALKVMVIAKESTSLAYFPVEPYGDALGTCAPVTGNGVMNIQLVPEGFTELPAADAQSRGRIQGTPPVAPRVTFAPPASKEGGAASSWGASFDLEALVSTMRQVVRDEVRDVMAKETERIVEAVKEAVKTSVGPSAAPARSVESREVQRTQLDVEDLVGRISATVRNETESQTARLEAAMTATATAAAAVSAKQNGGNSAGRWFGKSL